MLLSIALIITLGLITGSICEKLNFPKLLGFLLIGLLIGPHVLNLLDPKILNISNELRKIALILILTRAGLGLNLDDLKKIGRPAFFLCFLPATFEILGVTLFGTLFMHLSLYEAALLGSVLAAVSPAVVVPRMVKLIDENLGTKKRIPQMILAGASVDDVYVLVVFTTFLSLLQGKDLDILQFINIPISIVLGIFLGLLLGFLLSKGFNFFSVQRNYQILILLSLSFFLVSLEDSLTTTITFSSLISIMFMGIGIKKKEEEPIAKNLSIHYNTLWSVAEIFLFVLVGAAVDISYANSIGWISILCIGFALVFRMAGVALCLIKTNFSIKERFFIMLAYCPKATVQAAIGAIPLSAGLACGNIILTIAVVSILLTAPLGAFMIDHTKNWLLK